jgi:hypothetical protein
MWQLFEIGDTWIVIALPMFMVCMETSFMEPAWQPFLGRPPFRMVSAAWRCLELEMCLRGCLRGACADA